MTPSLRTIPLLLTRLRVGSTRTLLAVAVLALALAAAATSFSGASLTAHSSAAAALSAGTLRLTNATDGQPLLSGSPLGPGASVSGSTTLTNAGDVRATLRLTAASLADAPPSSGLASALRATVLDHASGTTLWSGTLAALAGGADLGTLAAGARRTVDIALAWPADAKSPSLQGASTSFRLTWEAAS